MTEVLQGLPLENLFIINVSNLQNVITQIAAAVRQNATDIQVMQDHFASLQDGHNNKKQSDKLAQQDLKQEVDAVREQLKSLVTSNDMHQLRFNMEQKQKALEEGLGKVKEEATTALEEIGGLRGEVIKHQSGLGSCKRDLDKLQKEYNTSSSSFDYKLENLDNKFSSFVNNTSALVTKEELKGKVKDEVQSLRRDIEEMHRATAEVHGQLQKKLTQVLEGDFEETKQAIPELRLSVQELMKHTSTSSADVMSIKVFLENQSKVIKELQEYVETKADKNSLEDVAKYHPPPPSLLLLPPLTTSPPLIKRIYAVNTRSKMVDTLQNSQQREAIKTQSLANSIENGTTEHGNGLQKTPTQPQASLPQPQLTPARPSTPQKRPVTPTTPITSLTPLTPLTFSTVSPSRDSYTGGNPPEFAIPNFSTFIVADVHSGDQTKTDDASQYMSIVADTVDTPAPELMSKEIRETQRQCVDLRKDLSDLASLVEVLTSELKRVKDKDSSSGEVWQALDLHTQQLSHLLHTKADLSNVENVLSSREPQPPQPPRDHIAKLLSNNGSNHVSPHDDMDSLRQAVNSKATREELRKMRRALQKELEKAMRDNLSLGGMMMMSDPEGAALATRAHYKCLACDRLIWKINGSKQGNAEKPNEPKLMPNANYDIAPNIAWRRSQVKELVGNKHNHPTTVNTLLNTIGNNLVPPTASLTSHSLPHSHPHPHSHSHPHTASKSPQKTRAVTPTLPLPLPPISSPPPQPRTTSAHERGRKEVVGDGSDGREDP